VQRLDFLIRCRLGSRPLVFRHQLEIGVVDRRCDPFEQLLMGLSDREGHRLPLLRDGDTLGHGLIECIDPLDHRNLCCVDLRAPAGVQRPQALDPRYEITSLLGDLLGYLGTTGLVLDRHQLRRGGDKAARLLGEPKRMHRRGHAL
jgi:hypothetical protein